MPLLLVYLAFDHCLVNGLQLLSAWGKEKE